MAMKWKSKCDWEQFEKAKRNIEIALLRIEHCAKQDMDPRKSLHELFLSYDMVNLLISTALVESGSVDSGPYVTGEETDEG